MRTTGKCPPNSATVSDKIRIPSANDCDSLCEGHNDGLYAIPLVGNRCAARFPEKGKRCIRKDQFCVGCSKNSKCHLEVTARSVNFREITFKRLVM
ncbi:hypothetical protein GCM10011341_05190 [Frigidibacter albus]|nr:hypothetical protein GCM10011341_05190 [Frigidibacter albus]